MPHDVFISYSSHDKTVADAICAALEAERIRCWISPRDVLAGKEYAREIVDAINECQVMVLVFSAYANTSKDIDSEVHLAFTRDKPIVSLRIENVLPEGGMEYRLSKIHWLDALTPPLKARIGELVACVGRLLNRQLSSPSYNPPRSEPENTRAQKAAQELSQTAPVPSVARSLKGPSWALMLLGGLFLCAAILGAIGAGMNVRSNGFTEEGSIAGSVMVVLAMVGNVIAVWAGFNMARARHYRLCFAGALSLVPGTFLLGTPVTIWVVWAMLKPGVRAAFERSAVRERPVREKSARKEIASGKPGGLPGAIGLSLASGLQVFFFVCSVVVFVVMIATKNTDAEERASNWSHLGLITCVCGLMYAVPGVLGLLSLKRPTLRYAVACVNGLVAALVLFSLVGLALMKEWLPLTIMLLVFFLYVGISILFYRAAKGGIAILGDAAFFNRRGLLRSVRGEANLAIEDFTKAIALEPKCALAFFNRAVTYRDLGQRQRAMADLQNAVELEPKDATSYYLRGCVLMELSEYENAVADFSRAIGLKPQLKDAYANRAHCYAKLREDAKAASDSFEASNLRRSTYSGTKVGRNDCCPCGSDKQFKYCCGLYFSA